MDIKKPVILLLAVLAGTVVMAQDEIQEDRIEGKSNDGWYASPWLWIVGAAIFILLLVALTRGKRD